MLTFITNRKLCKEDFLHRIAQLTKGRPQAIMLREKDLSTPEYEALALKVQEICELNQVPLVINKYFEIAAKLKIPRIHLSLPDLRANRTKLGKFQQIGASVHSLQEAQEAQALGASYLLAGHIFATDCKKGVPARGLSFLEGVCAAVTIPVYAIGGITTANLPDVLKAGASGVCVMSEAMTCSNPEELASSFRV